jgi:heme exporter protein D
MMKTLQELGATPLYAAAAILAVLLLARVWAVRRRRQRAILREVARLQRELAAREAIESQDNASL